MYTFLYEKENRIKFDFVLETLNAVEFSNWYANEKLYHIKGIKQLETLKKYSTASIPVGSIEFVERYYKTLLGVELKPINIPVELFDYAKRKVWYGTEKEQIDRNIFCKSADKIKQFTDIITSRTKLDKGNYMFSDLIEIDSEWRCFVLRGELLAIHNYSNSLGLIPDIEQIRRMIDAYKGLEAYTLDIGVNKNQGTFVIEVHDYYSCGLYGFNNYRKHLQMLIVSHNDKVKKYS